MPPPSHPEPVTEDALTRHRLEELEKMAIGWREAERRVDALGLAIAAVEKTTTQIASESRSRDERTHASLARLHTRLDEITTAESFEKGREAGELSARSRTWKIVAATLTIAIAFGALMVGVLTLAGVG